MFESCFYAGTDSFLLCFVVDSYWYFSRSGYWGGLHFPSSVFLAAFLPSPLSGPLSHSTHNQLCSNLSLYLLLVQ